MVHVRSDSINIEHKLYEHTYIGCHVENARRLKRSLTLIAFAINTRFPLSCRFFMFARTNARELWLRSRIIDTRVRDSFYFLLVNESSSNSLSLSFSFFRSFLLSECEWTWTRGFFSVSTSCRFRSPLLSQCSSSLHFRAFQTNVLWLGFLGFLD